MGSNVVRFDAIRTIAEATVTAVYQKLGTPFAHAMRVLNFKNNTDGDMMISFDGVTDNIFVAADSFDLYDLTSDEDGNESFRYEIGSQIWIRYVTAPTTGSFYVVAIYGRGE